MLLLLFIFLTLLLSLIFLISLLVLIFLFTSFDVFDASIALHMFIG